MKLLHSLRARAALLAACVAFPVALDARYENSLPDSTFAAFQVRDVAKQRERWAKPGALADDLKKSGFDDAVAAFFQKLETDLGKKEKNRGDLERLQFIKKLFAEGFLNGEITGGLIHVPKPEKHHEAFDFVAAVDLNADEARFLEIFATLSKGDKNPLDEAKKNKFQGVTIYEFERSFTVGSDSDEADSANKAAKKETSTVFAFAVVGKTFVCATSKGALHDLVDAVKNGGRKDNLTTTVAWKRGAHAFATADSLLVGNLPFATSLLRKFVVAQAAEEAGGNIVAVDYVKAYDTLALDTFESFWFTSEATPDQITLKSAIPFKEKRGLLSLLTVKPLDVFVPDFVPPGTYLWSTMRLDFAQAWKNLDALLGQAIPTLKPMLDGQIEQIKAKEGLDIRGAILENFGDHFTQIIEYPKAEQLFRKTDSGRVELKETAQLSGACGVYVVDVLDTAKFVSFLDTALSKAGKASGEELFAERTFQGVKIRTIKETLKSENAFPISFAVDSGRLYLSVGAEEVFNQVIAQSKAPSKAFAQTPVVRQALKFAPKNSFAFGTTEFAPVYTYLFNMFEAGFKSGGSHDKDTAEILDILKKFSPAKLPWALASFSEIRGNEIYSEGIVFRIDSK